MSYRNNRRRNSLGLLAVAIFISALAVASQVLAWLHAATVIAGALIATALVAWLGLRFAAFWHDIWTTRRAFNQAVDEANAHRNMEPLSHLNTDTRS
ncbi:membrane-associated phospholipid phosphatase [Azospirillum sp. OGB3]|uniref:Uncharacterized protein n=1 Tax=Azospirillum argentinense TaxID=2970906 RepID=A0A5B0KSK1_9PROT|nr:MULTISPECIES: hypothetical protein [Azospirillum]KAA1053774.1 hypothetical protein FH063_002356 [Azospirillum argentinense]MBB3267750.1 membrane-associated phospholipid phosphatase [Azospirillum sp. OGB3]